MNWFLDSFYQFPFNQFRSPFIILGNQLSHNS